MAADKDIDQLTHAYDQVRDLKALVNLKNDEFYEFRDFLINNASAAVLDHYDTRIHNYHVSIKDILNRRRKVRLDASNDKWLGWILIFFFGLIPWINGVVAFAK